MDGVGMDVTVFGAALAGLLSFFSPCVLPLVPAYLCFLSGASMEDLMQQDNPDRQLERRVFISALFFVTGFSIVFVILGAAATVLSQFVAQHMIILSRIAGVIIVLFGLHYSGMLRIPLLNFEKRFHMDSRPAGLMGSFLLGLAFAFGWTPCVGPILATILMLATTGNDSSGGILLLTVYALGIGIPFLIAAFGVRPFMAFMRRFRHHMRRVEITIGVLLITTGVMIFTGSLSAISNWLLQSVPWFSRVG
jgi:cytochrome c-type biogenesis protein